MREEIRQELERRRMEMSNEDQELEAKREEPKPQPPHRPQPQPPPPTEPDEPIDEPKEDVAETIRAQFQMLAQELRKPIVNPQVEARKRRTREHNRTLMSDRKKMMLARFDNCNHMQLPGSVLTGCSVIAWATQSDHRKRGICQHCGTVFSSVREECASQEIYEAYRMLVRIPTHPGGSINSVFQAA